MIVEFLKKSWLVMVAALVYGLLLAVVNAALSEKIQQQSRDKISDKMDVLFGPGTAADMITDKDGTEPQPLTAMTDTTLIPRIYEVKNEAGELQGYACIAVDGGYADKIRLLIGVDPQIETLLGYAVLKSNETPGFGDKIMKDPFQSQFKNCPIDQKLVVQKTGDRDKKDNVIVAITGATVSSEATTRIVNNGITALRNTIQP